MDRSSRLDQAERLVEDRGHGVGPVRVAVGRSGFAVGVPRDPLLHLSRVVSVAIGGLAFAIELRRS